MFNTLIIIVITIIVNRHNTPTVSAIEINLGAYLINFKILVYKLKNKLNTRISKLILSVILFSTNFNKMGGICFLFNFKCTGFSFEFF